MTTNIIGNTIITIAIFVIMKMKQCRTWVGVFLTSMMARMHGNTEAAGEPMPSHSAHASSSGGFPKARATFHIFKRGHRDYIVYKALSQN